VADLRGANLREANLSEAYLFHANLFQANLIGANLSNAKLSDAKLIEAHLSGADLSEAYLSGANLSGANLKDANLKDANLFQADLFQADLSGADLSGADLSGADLFMANLRDANLSAAELKGVNLDAALMPSTAPPSLSKGTPKQSNSVPGMRTSTVMSAPPHQVFIVHGHDEAAREAVARLVERAGLEAVILREQPNQGRTIIEKFEKHSETADFAVVLLTPDDVGGPCGTATEELRLRARQNVVAELFFFIGKLGRNRVCALVKGNIELPSDFAGVVYQPMDEAGHWQLALAQEMRSVGLPVDLNKIFRR
jgi:predicted nucleotide-binding protein